MKIVCNVALFCAIAGTVTAAEFTLKESCDGTVVDWTASANYVGEPELPQDRSEMVIRVPAITVTVTDETVGGLLGVDQILPQSAQTKIVFDLDRDASLGCCITPVVKGSTSGNDGNLSTIVKKGTGALHLLSADKRPWAGTSPDLSMDYAVVVDVQEGALHLPDAAGKYNRQRYQSLNVGESATLFLGSNMNEIRSSVISGSGLITNLQTTGTTTLEPYYATSTFSGRIGGHVCVQLYSANWTLPRTDSTHDRATKLMYGSTLNVASIGLKGEPSSLGIYSSANAASTDFYSTSDGGRLRYIGQGETSDKVFECSVASARVRSFWLDGGPFGGLVHKGYWNQSSTTTLWRNQTVELCGSNATPCVVSGFVKKGKRNDGYDSYYIFSKTGTGTWIFDGEKDGLATPLYIYGGTFGFGWLDAAGIDCPAGTATHLVADTNEDTRAASPVDFAFQLGREGSDEIGRFALSGTNITLCTTRPFVLAGRGGVRNDMPVPLRLSDFRVLGTGERELTLDGVGTEQNEIAGIMDSDEGPISVVKDGTGTWALNGSNTLHGAITVRGGTLKVMNRAETKYTWFNFLIRGKSDGSNTYCGHIGRLGLYDADGQKAFANPNYVNRETAGAIPTLRPGDMALPRPRKTHWGVANARNLFGTSSGYWEFAYKKPLGNNDSEQIDPARPATWIPVLFRLHDTDPAVASYDFTQVYGAGTTVANAKLRQICAWSLLGSLDGIHWDALSEVEKYEFPEEDHTWASRGTVYAKDATDLPHTGGFALPGAGYAPRPLPFTVMDHVASVSVVSGGVFACEGAAATIRGLVVDATSGGTVSNCTLAADATLDVRNLDPQAKSVTLPGTYQDVTGLDDVSGWTLKVDGEPTTRYGLSSRDGKLTVYKNGIILILR